jgi:hypothetical protein
MYICICVYIYFTFVLMGVSIPYFGPSKFVAAHGHVRSGLKFITKSYNLLLINLYIAQT